MSSQTRNGMDDTDPPRTGYRAGRTKNYDVYTIEPHATSVRLSFQRQDCGHDAELPGIVSVTMHFARKNVIDKSRNKGRIVPEEVLAFASSFTEADHLIERLDFHREAAELEEYVGRHFKAMLRRTKKIPAIERKLAKLYTSAEQAA